MSFATHRRGVDQGSGRGFNQSSYHAKLYRRTTSKKGTKAHKWRTCVTLRAGCLSTLHPTSNTISVLVREIDHLPARSKATTAMDIIPNKLGKKTSTSNMSASKTAIDQQLASGAVPNYVSNVCPQGTKMWLLEVGWLECDEGFVVRGGNASVSSTAGESFVNKRRQLPVSVLEDRPFNDFKTDTPSDVLRIDRAPSRRPDPLGDRFRQRLPDSLGSPTVGCLHPRALRGQARVGRANRGDRPQC